MSVSPLLQRPSNAPIAWLSKSLPGLSIGNGIGVSDGAADAGLEVSNEAFLNHVARVAQALPEHNHAINLCDNRYLFLVCLCASTLRGATSLLAPNKNASSQQSLAERYAECIVVHDDSCEIISDVPQWCARDLDWALDQTPRAIPDIERDHLSVISFTSGSTGESKPNLKSWNTLEQSSKINARYMLPDADQCFYHLATVPGQHMWGFETSVLLPLFANACLVDSRPLYPADIIDALAKLPTPRCLISTPVHLRALEASAKQRRDSKQENLPALANLLCATAPLADSLASSVEELLGTELREVYGCSEVGSMAVRRSSQTSLWQPFEGLNFSFSEPAESQASDSVASVSETNASVTGASVTGVSVTGVSVTGVSVTMVSASHLPEVIRLEDQLLVNSDGQFELAGRSSDQIKIAGKRGSLAQANKVLHDHGGVIDGVVIFPEQDRPIPRLVALVIVREGMDKPQLRAHFAKYLDSAFVPRPIYLVDELPREENGKLSKARVLALYQSLQS